MSSIALQGGATGTGVVSLVAPSTSTNRTLTLPDVTGTVAVQGGTGVGKVLQVVNATYSTETSTTSTSYVTTGLSASITPSSSSSKILIFASNMLRAPAGNNSNFSVFRGTVAGTNLAGASGFAAYYTSGADTGVSVNYLDSPATASLQTYTCAFKASGGTAVIQAGAGTATLTLMEIAA